MSREPKMSKVRQEIAALKNLDEMTHRQWNHFARGYRRKWPQVCTISISQPCVCRCCKQEHTKEIVLTAFGDHRRALQVAYRLFFIGRPGIPADQIKDVLVKGPSVECTSITRNSDGKAKVGYTWNHGTIQELADAGVLKPQPPSIYEEVFGKAPPGTRYPSAPFGA